MTMTSTRSSSPSKSQSKKSNGLNGSRSPSKSKNAVEEDGENGCGDGEEPIVVMGNGNGHTTTTTMMNGNHLHACKNSSKGSGISGNNDSGSNGKTTTTSSHHDDDHNNNNNVAERRREQSSSSASDKKSGDCSSSSGGGCATIRCLTKTSLKLARTVLLGLSVSMFFAVLVLIVASRLDMTIHSCDIYSPSILPAAAGVSRAIGAFFEQEGFGVFLEVFWHLTRMELFRRPPYYQGDAVRGKRLLVLGGSYIPEFFDTARRLGVEVVIVDDISQEHRMKTQASHFISVQNYPRVSITDPDAVVSAIESYFQKQNISPSGLFDGVTTLVEDQGPLVARMASHFNVRGSSLEAADIARNKIKFRKTMQQAKLPTPKFFLIESEGDLEKAAKHVGLPSFLKPVYGVAATFASTVHTMDELKDTYHRCQSSIDPKRHPIYHYGAQMMLEGIMKGSEVQLELMLYDGEVVFHCFSSEYSPKRDFVVFPSNLTEQTKNEMLSIAKRTVNAIGLSWGVVHLEMFVDEVEGPQVIEVNNRLSRGFLPQQYFHQLFFGEKVVDYFGCVIFLALGMRPPLHPRSTPVASVAVFPDGRSEVGWETNGPCAIFFGASPREALQQGYDWIANGRPFHTLWIVALQLALGGLCCFALARSIKTQCLKEEEEQQQQKKKKKTIGVGVNGVHSSSKSSKTRKTE